MLSFVEALLIAVGMAMDALAVSLGIGTARLATTGRSIFRLSFHFGLFQALMPVLGWLAGTTIAPLISGVDHWVAMGLLGFVGGRMVRAGFDSSPERRQRGDPSRGLTLILLSVAVSIDALAVGLTLAMLRVSIWYPAVLIGLVTGALSLGGLLLGDRLGETFGRRTEVVGGLILIGIGLRILITHLRG